MKNVYPHGWRCKYTYRHTYIIFHLQTHKYIYTDREKASCLSSEKIFKGSLYEIRKCWMLYGCANIILFRESFVALYLEPCCFIGSHKFCIWDNISEA